MSTGCQDEYNITCSFISCCIFLYLFIYPSRCSFFKSLHPVNQIILNCISEKQKPSPFYHCLMFTCSQKSNHNFELQPPFSFLVNVSTIMDISCNPVSWKLCLHTICNIRYVLKEMVMLPGLCLFFFFFTYLQSSQSCSVM